MYADTQHACAMLHMYINHFIKRRHVTITLYVGLRDNYWTVTNKHTFN